MKALILILLLSTPAFADTLLDKPTAKVNSQVMTRGTLWNKDYREARRANPAGGETAWRGAADVKEKERKDRARSAVPLFMQRRTVDVFIHR